MTLPYKPHIGTLSCSPQIDFHQLADAGRPWRQHGSAGHGPPAPITYLPVTRAGRAAIYRRCPRPARATARSAASRSSTPPRPTITVDLIKDWTIDWPRLEADDFIMTIGSARPLEDATRIAYRELVRWMVKDYGYDQWDAYMMLSQCGKVQARQLRRPQVHHGARRSRRSTCSRAPALFKTHTAIRPRRTVPGLDDEGVDARARAALSPSSRGTGSAVVLYDGCAELAGPFRRPLWAMVGIEQRGVGSEMRSRTSSPMASSRPTQPFSTNPVCARGRRDCHVRAEAPRM